MVEKMLNLKEEIKEKIIREETDTIENVGQTIAERLLEIENNKDVDNFIKTDFCVLFLTTYGYILPCFLFSIHPVRYIIKVTEIIRKNV